MPINPLRADRASLDIVDAILEALPWPALMLAQDGTVLATSEEVDARRGLASAGHAKAAEPSLRERAPHYLRALHGGPPWLKAEEVDSVRLLPSGEPVHERLVLRCTPWGACLSVVDQTELRRLQTTDVQTARLAALGFMVAGVSHEISNPLTSLNSVVQILRSQPQLRPELLAKGLDNIAASVGKLLDISRRLVRFSRVGDEPRSRFAVDVAVGEALQVLRYDGLLGGVALHWQADDAACVSGNATQVSEVFLNLLLNAVQAMEGGGRLDIETSCDASTVSVVLHDSGPGISEAVLPRLFEPFFTTRSRSNGTGLGLAISREIVLEHAGTLVAEPAAQGARFRVKLPRALP